MRVAINGFGRIGRMVLRALAQQGSSSVEVVAINDLMPVDNLVYLLKYDSVHGRFHRNVQVKEGTKLCIEGLNEIRLLSVQQVEELPWKSLGIDCVLESTGLFLSQEKASKHVQAGARHVVISAPGKEGVPVFVMGVNQTNFDPQKHSVVSMASCTTNCLAPLAKVILDHCGIEEALLTTVHATTATHSPVDSPNKKNWRLGRACGANIIPSSTGAAEAVAQCIPELKGKMTGMAFRVPTLDVSVIDFTVRTRVKTSYEQICKAVKTAAESENLKNILHYIEEPLVSSDFVGERYSSIFDASAGLSLNDKFFKIVAWYDNENGYAWRIADFLSYISRAVEH